MNCQAPKILIVDDEQAICQIISRRLTAEGYACRTASTVESAVELLERDQFALALVDIMMPGMSGVDLLAFVKSRVPNVAVIMVTGVNDMKTALMTLQMGAYGYLIKPVDSTALIINVASALERRRIMLEAREHEQTMTQEVQERSEMVSRMGEEMVTRMILAATLARSETLVHARRIGMYAAVIAKYLFWDDDAVECIRLAAQLHDIGQTRLPGSLVTKTERLSPQEAEMMKTHTVMGARILEGASVPFLRMARDIALCHHEKWNGSGYPHGMRGDFIPRSARIVAIVDAYDTLTHNQLNRKAFTQDKAVAIMAAYRGDAFDPRIFDYSLTLLPHLRSISEEFEEEDVAAGSASKCA